jgi:hypothetical protein
VPRSGGLNRPQDGKRIAPGLMEAVAAGRETTLPSRRWTSPRSRSPAAHQRPKMPATGLSCALQRPVATGSVTVGNTAVTWYFGHQSDVVWRRAETASARPSESYGSEGLGFESLWARCFSCRAQRAS